MMTPANTAPPLSFQNLGMFATQQFDWETLESLAPHSHIKYMKKMHIDNLFALAVWQTSSNYIDMTPGPADCFGSKELKLLQCLEDLLGTRDCELASFLDVCNGDLEVVSKESKALRTKTQSFLREIKLKTKCFCVCCRSISKELHMLVLWVCLCPCLHDKGVINADKQDLIYTLGFEILSLSNEAWYMLIAAGGGEGTGDAEEDDLLAGGQGVDGDLLQLVVLVEPPELAVGEGAAHANRSHGRSCLLWVWEGGRRV